MSESSEISSWEYGYSYFRYGGVVQPEKEGEGVCVVSLKNDEVCLQGRDTEATGRAPKLNLVDN